MSGHGFHVHGPHDHELEHAAQEGHGSREQGGGIIAQMAAITAIIATVGAIFSYMGGATQANAGLYKNNAALRKTEASNQWNYFQAKSTKQALAELARDLASDDKKSAYQSKVDRYEKEKAESKTVADKLEADAPETVAVPERPRRKAAADKLEADALQWDKQSDEPMHQHHRWAQATTVLQIAIALAAIALLTRMKWFDHAMFGLAGIGLLTGGLAALHY